MDGQPSRRVGTGSFKARRAKLPCLLKREVLKSMGIAQLRTIGRSNRRSTVENGVVESPPPSMFETRVETSNKSSSPVEESRVPDEDCVISHIQPPMTRKRGPTDSGPLLIGSKPVPPLKIKRVKGNDGSVTYRVQRCEGVANTCSGLSPKGLNMRVWPRKYWMGRGSPSMPTNSKKVSTSRSDDAVVDLTGGSSEDEGMCSDPGACARTMEFRRAIARSSTSRPTTHNTSQPNSLSNEVLIRSPMPGSNHYAAARNRAILSAVAGTLKNSIASATTVPTYVALPQSLLATALSNAVGFPVQSVTPNPVPSMPSLLPSTRGGAVQQRSTSHSDPRICRPSDRAILNSILSGGGTGLTSPRTPRMTPPKPALPRTARVLNLSHFTELNHLQQANSATTPGAGSDANGVLRSGPCREDEESSIGRRVVRRVEYTSPQSKTHADGRNSVESASALKFSTELEKMLKHEEVFDVKTVNGSVYLLVKQHSGCAAEWITVSQCRSYLQLKSLWKLQLSQLNGGRPVVPPNSTTPPLPSTVNSKLPVPSKLSVTGKSSVTSKSSVISKPPVANCIKTSGAKPLPASIPSTSGDRKSKGKFVVRESSSHGSVSESSSSSTNSGTSSVSSSTSSVSSGSAYCLSSSAQTVAAIKKSSSGSASSSSSSSSARTSALVNKNSNGSSASSSSSSYRAIAVVKRTASSSSSSAQSGAFVNKNALNDYRLQLMSWQAHLNRQQGGREAPIFIENSVDRAPIPRDFTYIIRSVRTEGVPPSEVLLGCKCQKCDATCKQCCSGLAGCPFPYTKAGRLRVAPGMPIYECNDACRCTSGCYNRVVQNGRVIPLTIFRTNDGRGWGVKTRQAIKKNTFVTEYVGEIITNKEAELRGAIYDEEGSTYLFDLDFHEEDVDDGEDSLFTIDARKFGNISHFINHSCDPNLQVYSVWIETLDHRLPHLAFFALKDIQENEELTFDYNMGRNMANITSKPKIKCLCGVPNCAGFLY